MIQAEFRTLVDEAVRCCKAYFGKRFLAAYIHGSVDKGDAVAGISDLDLFVVPLQKRIDEDLVWIKEFSNELSRKYDVIDEAHITLADKADLTIDRFSRFALAYNATLIEGVDVVRMLNECDGERYQPNKELAQMRLDFAKRCFIEAQNGKEPACTGALPQDTYYITRKFARYFVVIEGAYFLMSRGLFTSFDKSDVLGKLRNEAKEYGRIIDITKDVLTDPVDAGMNHADFLHLIAPLVYWFFSQIENA